MSTTGKDTRLALGASPRVHLLPPEVGDRKRGAAIRRSVVFAVIGAVAVCALGYGAASFLAIDASAKYDEARAKTAVLLAEQGKYSEVRTLAAFQQTLTDARQVGALTEINWSDFYGRIMPTVPADLAIESFTIDAGSPIEDFAVASLPGDAPRVATATFVANTATLASAQGWVVALKSLPEFAGARATTIARNDDGTIAVTVALHITEAAYSKRFMPLPEPAPETATEPAALEGAN
jgi:hypothetical protein